MARYLGPRCKKMRRNGKDLLLLSARRNVETKCKLNTAPGQHGAAKKMGGSNFFKQLREKQKLKIIYGVLERQFRRLFKKAKSMRGSTGDNIVTILESRLDNVVYRSGFASTRAEARQLVSHGAVFVNSKKVDIPSYLVEDGDLIEINQKAKKQSRIISAIELAQAKNLPYWIEVNFQDMIATYKSAPKVSDLNLDVNMQLVVELCN